MDWEHFYSSFRKPDFIPGFEIQNRLGGGAFGDVYKARKVSIDKAYAIKFLKIDESTTRAAIERELEQVRHFSAIDHPNLVTVEDMGVALDVPYLVMGYAGEDTLARRLKRERLDPAHALSLFVQTCRGVAALHERRLAHFDLKPSNVFLKGDVARVGDYGLAKLLIDGRQTLSFGRGTPQYMAPEMLKNRADHRADIYSLGVILYEMYCGGLPFETSPDAGVVLREDDTLPEFPGQVPLRVRRAIEGCLRIEPAHRFQSVRLLLDMLGQTARAGDPLVAIESLTSAVPPLPGAAAPGSAAAATPPGAKRSELRSTATDLTRGAVEVARGVWEGLRSPRPVPSGTPPPPPIPAPGAGPVPGSWSPRAEPAADVLPKVPAVAAAAALPLTEPASDVISIETLDEAAARALPSPRAFAAMAPYPAPPVPALPAVHWSGTTTAAVPVPPRSTRGFFGALRATLELGLEVLMALVSGPLRRSLGGMGRAGGTLVRGGKSWIVAGLRLALFLAGMLLLGAALMYLVFLFASQT